MRMIISLGKINISASSSVIDTQTALYIKDKLEGYGHISLEKGPMAKRAIISRTSEWPSQQK